VDNVQPVTELAGLEINQVFLGSCTNGREDDLAIAAKIIKGKKIHPRVRLIIAPASRKIMLDSMASGDLTELIRAGGTIITPGCGPCLGAHQGLLAAGERVLATSNRNFKGRIGSPDAEVYLGSPATAAASALTGVITDPREYVK
jgi:3-isopropylmalate/(R)-2-methylmalate dehydratase large subunit